MVSEERIKELKKIISQEYGQELSFKEASEIGNTLTEYFDLLAKMYWQANNPSEE